MIYHDEIKAIQAFPQFEDPVLKHTLAVRDTFAINYGVAGAGAGFSPTGSESDQCSLALSASLKSSSFRHGLLAIRRR